MNKTRTQSMYTSDQPDELMPINIGGAKRSRSDSFCGQVRKIFLQQSAHYLNGNYHAGLVLRRVNAHGNTTSTNFY